MLLYHSADLLWASKIRSVADALGLAARPVRTLEMLEARLADSPVAALCVDLDAPDVALALIDRLRGEAATASQRGIRVLAYGPHVAVDALQQARERGASRVMTRGAFDRTMAEVIRDLTKATGPGTPAEG